MKRALCAGLALLAFSAQADFITNNGRDSVRLMTTECLLPIPQKDVMLAAVAVIGGKEWQACWAPISREWIGLIFSDGDTGQIPTSEFRRAPEA